MIGRLALLAALAAASVAAADTPLVPRARARARVTGVATPGETVPLALDAGAFPGSGAPDVLVHVPPGFDATRRPGVIVYFHGWMGCAAAALAGEDTPCSASGPTRRASDLAAQLDAAGANALLVAVELRADMPTGEPGRLAMPGGLREMLQEVLGALAQRGPGPAIEVDALDRVVVMAHSGGYQAAASVLAWGDVPRVTEVDLLDALYGGDDLFFDWIRSQANRFDPGAGDPLRFVDLYTCCGSTVVPSRSLAARAGALLGAAGLAGAFGDDDGPSELGPPDLAHNVVFKRVPRAHEVLPGAYFGELVRAAGFAPTASTGGIGGPATPRTRYD